LIFLTPQKYFFLPYRQNNINSKSGNAITICIYPFIPVAILNAGRESIFSGCWAGTASTFLSPETRKSELL
jgi:hypothetical protein